MNRALFGFLLACLVVVPRALPAQEAPALVKWGKWGALAAGVGFLAVAAMHHRDADDAYGALERRCNLVSSLCTLGPGGEYLDPTSEELYQEALDQDAAARRWLVATEVALIGTALLFVWDFMHEGNPEDDTIPFTPHVDAARGQLGAAFRF